MTVIEENDSGYVFAFRELDSETLPKAGGKGSALAQLLQRGYPVPDGFVIIPSAFSNNELKTEAWDQVQVYLSKHRKRNKKAAFAVRSSALAEDSAFAAFAGQFETILNVTTDEEILQAIHTVHQSKHSERVEAYSKTKGIDFQHEITIIIQELIPSEISGVLFTADPLTGSISKMSGSYVYGMGDQLVSGESDAIEFQYSRPKGGFEGPNEFKKYAKTLYKLASKIEADLGLPQDIEWAISKGKVFLLQSRPITTLLGYDPVLAYYNESFKGDYFWTFTGVGELVPNILKPSDWSIWEIYNTSCSEHDWFLPHLMYANIAGRLYTNASIMVTAMRRVFFSEERIKDMFREAMGDIPPEVKIATFHFSWKTFLTKTIPDERKWQQKVKRLKAEIPSFLAEFPKKFHLLREKIEQATDKSVLANMWAADIEPAYHEAIWMMKVANEVFYNPYNALSIELGKKVGKSDSNILIQGRPKDLQSLESLGPLVGLRDILEGDLSRDEYMKRYGHRDPFENYLSYSRPAEEPSWLDKQLESYTPLDYDGIMKERIIEFDAAVERLKQTVKPKKAKKYLEKIETLLEEMHVREDLRSELTRSIWLIRIYLLKASSLLGLGDEIFYLEIPEIINLLQDKQREVLNYLPARKEFFNKLEALPPYPPMINGRFDPFEWANDPDRKDDLFDSHIKLSKKTLEDPNIVTGLPGSTGKVEGVVRKISDPDEGDQFLAGEILVTRTTNVGWTPLFGRAAGIVTDIGSPLAHAAIVARELKIPAVVGCRDATRRLKTGDRIILDGGNGSIQILRD